MKKTFIPMLIGCSLTASAQTAEQWNAIRTDIHPASRKSIDAIIRRIGDRRVVAIGEESHGTGDYYAFRHALTQRLVEEKGFTVVVLENPHEDMVQLQASLGSLPLDTLMRRHLFAIYQTAEMKRFLEWAQQHARKNPSFRLAGCDDSFRDLTPRLIRQRLAKYHHPALDALLDEYALRASMKAPQYYALPGKTMPPGTGKYNGIYDYYLHTYRTIQQIDSIYKTLPAKDQLVDELLFHGYSSFAMAPAAVYRDFGLSRDSLMAARINYFTRQEGAKVIVWAHNAHVANTPVIDDIGRMGQEVGIANPGQYCSIGLNTGEGSYSYIKTRLINADHDFRDSLFNKALLPLKQDSWNAAMQQQARGPVLYDFSRVKAGDQALFHAKKPYRFVGHTVETTADGSYFTTAPALLYNMVLFFPVTRHTQSLF